MCYMKIFVCHLTAPPLQCVQGSCARSELRGSPRRLLRRHVETLRLIPFALSSLLPSLGALQPCCILWMLALSDSVCSQMWFLSSSLSAWPVQLTQSCGV